MLEAYASLHPSDPRGQNMFMDLWLPRPLGHHRLATHLFEFLVESRLVPVDRTSNPPDED